MTDAPDVLVRLNTAVMALHSAVAEASRPATTRDAVLMESLLEALRYAQQAQAILNDWEPAT